MDLRQLRYFIMLAEVRNFNRAAERLNMSQPPLTVAIRKLEEELGGKLFHRDPRGLRLTDIGSAVLPSALDAVAHAHQVIETAHLAGVGARGKLTVGFVGSAISELLPRIIAPFRRSYPEVNLILEELNSVEIFRGIGTREIDIGLVRLPVLDSTPVMMDVIERDELIVALPTSDVLAEARAISLADLEDRPFIIYRQQSVLHARIRMACQAAGFSPRVTQEATQVQTILSLVQAGLGIALVPARTARFVPEGVRLALLKDSIAIELGIARARDAGPVVQNFVTSALGNSDIHEISRIAI